MITRIAVVMIAMAFVVSCSGLGTKKLSKEEFISTMAEVGCTQTTEGSVKAAKILDDKGITEKQIGLSQRPQ